MFDFTDPGFLGFIESEGMMDTNESLISRVAKVLETSPSDVIGIEEFRTACISAGVDPDSFSENDLQRLKEKVR